MNAVPCEKCGNVVASTSKMCPYCGKRPNSIRNFISSIFLLLFTAALIAKCNDDAATNQSANAEAQNLVSTADAPAPEIGMDAQNDQAASDPEQPAAIEEPQGAVADDIADDPAPQHNDAGLSRTIQLALENGQTEEWRSDDGKGYVVVSDLQAGSGRTCRNMFVTTIHGSRQEQSATALMCRSEAGEWLPE